MLVKNNGQTGGINIGFKNIKTKYGSTTWN